jgi:hypothetical protein
VQRCRQALRGLAEVAVEQMKQAQPNAEEEDRFRELEDSDRQQATWSSAWMRLGFAARCHLGMSFDRLISHSPVSPVDGLTAEMSTPPKRHGIYFHTTTTR